MFEEKTMKEAVCAYLDNIQVYVKTEGEDEALLPISCFKLEDLRNEEYRYIVDMPNLPKEVEERIEQYKEEKMEQEVVKNEEQPKTEKTVKVEKEKTLGEMCLELKEQGLPVKEIAVKLNRKPTSISQAIWNEKKKRERRELCDEEDLEEVYVQETVKRTSIVTGNEVTVDVKKARALRKAGWSIEKTADEFNISVRDMEAILDEQK